MAERRSIRRSAEKAAAILRERLREYEVREFAIELWDGTRFEPGSSNFCRW